MTDDQQQRPRSSITVWLIVAVVVVVAYVLLSGPAIGLYHRGYFKRAIYAAYRPLDVISRPPSPLAQPLNWYWNFWKPAPPPSLLRPPLPRPAGPIPVAPMPPQMPVD